MEYFILGFFLLGLGLGGLLRDWQWRRITGRSFYETRKARDHEKYLARFGSD